MPIDDLTALGQKMREARKNKELTQQELSDLSHVSVKQIANIEKGPQYPENPLWAHEATCPATVFFFPRLAGQDRLAYSVYSCSCAAASFSREKLSSLMMCSIRQASASAVLGSTPAAISCSVKKQ